MKSLLPTLIFLSFFSIFSQNKKLFTLLPSDKTEINFNNKIKDDSKKNILLYANFYGGAGVGVGDFNNDGLEDIYFAGNLVDDKLYLNQGNFKFKDITKSAGIVNDGSWSTSVIVADVNNDGLKDIYVTKELYDSKPVLRKNKLYINQGNAVFKERAEQYGVANSERTRSAVFFDYDKDGYLDLFLLNQPPNPGSYSSFFGTKLLQPQYRSKLYKNIKGKKFIDVSKKSGLNKTSFPNAVSASDLNNDGWIDLYVSNDFYMPDYMYINNQDGTFTNIANKALGHMSYYSMGVDIADINNDGNLDIFTVDMVAEDNFRLKSNMSGMNPKTFWNVVKNGGHYQYMYNTLQLNNGNDTYSEISQLLTIAATDWSWSNLIADFDNDGKKDLFVTNGLLRDIRNTDASKAVGDYVIKTANNWVKNHPNGGEVTIWDILDLDKTLSLLPSEKLSNYAFKNLGNYQFKKIASTWGLDTKSFSNGCAYADLDNDGDLDLIVNNINDKAFIYRNNSKNNFLRISLKSKTNKPTLGTKICVKYNDKKQYFETTNVRGIYSTSEQNVHFGVGKVQQIDTVTIHWPNNKITILKNVAVNQQIRAFLEDGTLMKKDKKRREKTLFKDITKQVKIDYQHKENNFDDYQYQVLLPHKLSEIGPALAVADVNNDGLDDLFLGQSVGEKPAIYFQYKNGNFKKHQSFNQDINYEDVDALFVDVDNDGDKDLYIVSGGNEFKAGSNSYEDRLYINNGAGDFKKATSNLLFTNISGSVVVAGDFDNDGDQDLFIGGRHVPHEYPLPATSKLLENRQGEFIDVTDEKSSELNELGMVTDAIWSDYDNDGDLDLIIVGEWMPITIFKNNNGFFTKQNLLDLQKTNGWWFSIAQGDFDNDGDLDYVVGNLGLNNKYKTSEKNPFDIYYKDFDKNGKKDIVLGYYNKGEHYPLRGFSCSSQQIPKLKKNFKKYDVFASLNIKQIYGKRNLKEALHYTVDTFKSVFVENKGNGHFKISSLPIEAQFSNSNDFLIDDFNKDGNLDILLAGNLFDFEIETPRNDAGTGLLLLGDGKNIFKPQNILNTGFFARKEVKNIKFLHTTKGKIIVVGNNNDKLSFFKLKK